MKNLIVFCILLVFTSVLAKRLSYRVRNNPPPPPGPVRRSEAININYFTQKLDHFDTENTDTWQQKYFVNSEFFNATSNDVVFLMLGGESAASASWMTYGSWVESARKYGALLFQLEHRFYGESIPSLDLSTENLAYLSSEQALEDAAEFIVGINKEYSLSSDVKWIVFGGSYSGSLAAWIRLKYPDLVYGSVASSAPLVAKLDFPEYYQVVLDDLASVSDTCVDILAKAYAQIDELLLNPQSTENLTSIFNLCKPIEELENDDLSVYNFYSVILNSFASTAQYNGLGGITINDLCDLLNDERPGKEIYRLASLISSLYEVDCLGYSYNADVEFLRDVTLLNGLYRQWIYQTCTEYGWYQTTQREDKILGRGTPVDYYTTLCQDVFGPEFNTSFINNQINLTNDFYGGLNINVTNVVYVHGTVDPWRMVGLRRTTNPLSPVIIIEGTAHCANMYEASDLNYPQLIAAQKEIDGIIGNWLGFN